MNKINWKMIGMGLSLATAALNVVCGIVETNRQKDDIREEVAKELDRREKERENKES